MYTPVKSRLVLPWLIFNGLITMNFVGSFQVIWSHNSLTCCVYMIFLFICLFIGWLVDFFSLVDYFVRLTRNQRYLLGTMTYSFLEGDIFQIGIIVIRPCSLPSNILSAYNPKLISPSLSLISKISLYQEVGQNLNSESSTSVCRFHTWEFKRLWLKHAWLK